MDIDSNNNDLKCTSYIYDKSIDFKQTNLKDLKFNNSYSDHLIPANTNKFVIDNMSITTNLKIEKNLNVRGTIESSTIDNLQLQIDNLKKELEDVKNELKNKRPRKTYN